MKTYRVRRSRPSALSLALALALTMLIVYLASVSARENSAPSKTVSKTEPTSLTEAISQTEAVSQTDAGSAEVRLAAMEADFVPEIVCADELSARVAAANCAQTGGAGFVLADGDQFAVIREATLQSGGADALRRHAEGLTLRLSGRAQDVTAVSDAAAFLYEQAAQTGALANAMDAGDTGADSVRALLNVYRTQGRRAAEELGRIETKSDAVDMLAAAVNCALERLESALRETSSAKMRLIHAAACAEWISLLNNLSDL